MERRAIAGNWGFGREIFVNPCVEVP